MSRKCEMLKASYTNINEAIYFGDSVESLRTKIGVLSYFDDGTAQEVADYTISASDGGDKILQDSIVVIEYRGFQFELTLSGVTNNPTSVIYDWDFTKSLIDKRQGRRAVLISQYDRISSLGTGKPPAYLDGNGVRFGEASQGILLLPPTVTADYFYGKTIQVDCASYVPLNNEQNTVFLSFGRGYNSDFFDGIVYENGKYWNARFNQVFDSGYTSLTARNAIGGHKIAVFVTSEGKLKLYVDGVLKGISTNSLPGTDKGLAIGTDGYLLDGGSLFISRITGARIYNGEVQN